MSWWCVIHSIALDISRRSLNSSDTASSPRLSPWLIVSWYGSWSLERAGRLILPPVVAGIIRVSEQIFVLLLAWRLRYARWSALRTLLTFPPVLPYPVRRSDLRSTILGIAASIMSSLTRRVLPWNLPWILLRISSIRRLLAITTPCWVRRNQLVSLLAIILVPCSLNIWDSAIFFPRLILIRRIKHLTFGRVNHLRLGCHSIVFPWYAARA